MKKVVVILFALAGLVSTAQAAPHQLKAKPHLSAGEVKYQCVKPNGNKIRDLTECKVQGSLLPTPTPTVTFTPAPTATPVVDCSDGNFGLVPGAKVLQIVNRLFAPGRVYRLCATVPADAVGHFFTLQSRNYSNGVCNLLGVWLVAPDLTTYAAPKAIQPGVAMIFERGKWAVSVLLDSNPETLCPQQEGWDLYLSWF